MRGRALREGLGREPTEPELWAVGLHPDPEQASLPVRDEGAELRNSGCLDFAYEPERAAWALL